jgi:hypothetical protein
MNFLYLVLYTLMSLFIGGMESEDWQERQFSHEVVECLTFVFQYPYPVEDALKAKDVEVKHRCKKILDKYCYIEIPPDLFMYDFYVPDTHRLHTTWKKANTLPVGRDREEFARLLMKDLGWTRSQVHIHIKYTELKKQYYASIDLFKSEYYKVVDYFCPPPKSWGCP